MDLNNYNNSELDMTCYKGYSKVINQISVKRFIELIRGGFFRKPINEIRQLLAEGDCLKANGLKCNLPYYTITATYREERLAYSLVRYNDLVMLDFDDMETEDLAELHKLADADPYTIADFISPRQHGLKILTYITSADALSLRQQLEAKQQVSYAELEEYHKQMFTLAGNYYAQLLHSKVDISGSDLSRGVYASYDPDAFFSDERMNAVKPLNVIVSLPTREECSSKKSKRKSKSESSPDLSDISQQASLDYSKALAYTRRKYRFEEGGRDNFIYCLGNQCYVRHVPETAAVRMALRDFGGSGDFDVETPLRNAYVYTSQTDAADQEMKKNRVDQIVDFLNENYSFRYNVVRDQVEFAKKKEGGKVYNSVRLRDLNSFYMELVRANISCTLALVRSLIESDFAPDYNPFIAYFESLPPWDGKTDYIRQLADTIDTPDPAFLHDALKRWLVGMVACAISDREENQLLLLLYSKQGKGKSRFIRNLLPSELEGYYRNGMINPDNKDHMLMLSSCLIINLEEFDGVSSNRLADLKRVITQDRVTERKVFDFQSHAFVRRASFAASTNNPHCLQEIAENRRILFISVDNIRYRMLVNHAGLYAQALALYYEGFQYWYEGDEIKMLNKRNERFRLKDPVEENLFFYYRAATACDFTAKWLPAATLLATISLNGRVQSNRQALQTLVYVLENNSFRKRVNANGVTEYAVMEYTVEERADNATRIVNMGESQQPLAFDEPSEEA